MRQSFIITSGVKVSAGVLACAPAIPKVVILLNSSADDTAVIKVFFIVKNDNRYKYLVSRC